MNWLSGVLQTNWAQIEWTHPGWLLLALQPLLMWLLLRLRRNQVRHYADAHLLPWVLRDTVDVKSENRQMLRNLAAWLLLAGALAGPRLPLPGGAQPQAKPQHALDVMVLLDVSASMQARDVPPQRLQRARLELLDLLPRLRGERLGLLAFSGSAGLIMPLNRDANAFRYFLDIADPALFETQGTALASALELALRNLPPETSPHRAILLVSDAETSALSGPAGAAAWEMADKLKQAGVPLFILGVGTEQGSTVTMPDGNLLVSDGEEVVSRMDASGFADLAGKTGGKFVRVEDGDADWQALYDNGLLAVPGGKPARESIVAWHELYGWLLLPALLLFAWLHFNYIIRIKILRLLMPAILLAVFSVPDSHASETEAYAAYRSQQLARAQALYAALPGYAARMGEGAAAYRRQDYLYAEKQFTAALLMASDTRQREQALFNLGNSYFMAGNYRAAAESFFGVLHYNNSNSDARANLALAAGKIAEQIRLNGRSNGMLGRIGRDTGGRLGEDAAEQPVAIDDKDKGKESVPGLGSELEKAEQAHLLQRMKALNGVATAATDPDTAWRAALKKLELEEDKPLALHRMLIKMEASRNYAPQLEMQPW